MKLNEELNKGIKYLIKKDPELKALFKKHGPLKFEPKMERSPYESLSRAIAHQQLHGKAAETILGRLQGHFDSKNFPEPQDIMKLPTETLRGFGFSQNKCKALKDIAQKTLDGAVPDKKHILKMTNEEIIERLIPIFGVGKWTVEMLLIFQLGRLNVWPADDFGVRNGYKFFKNKRKVPLAKEIKSLGHKWAPYQTIVALYLWREADSRKN